MFLPETKIRMKKLWQEHDQENSDKMCSDPVKDFVFEKKPLTQKPLYGGINMEDTWLSKAESDASSNLTFLISEGFLGTTGHTWTISRGMGPFNVEKWITFHYVWGGLDIYNRYNHHKSPEAVIILSFVLRQATMLPEDLFTSRFFGDNKKYLQESWGVDKDHQQSHTN